MNINIKNIEDNILFYRMDCLGGIPWIVYLYDKHGLDGINIYNKEILPTKSHCLHINSGIYPLEDHNVIEIFCKNYINCLKNCNYIGFWPQKNYFPEMELIKKYCSQKAMKPINHDSGHFGEVFWFNRENWYEKLYGKKILIISSHSKTMERQWFSNNLFRSQNKNINHNETLIELKFVKPPMSACGNKPHSSWIESLDHFKQDVDDKLQNFNLDLALVSCGGYSSSICDYIHQKYNKSVFYIGGALQLYFSILGNRWKNQISTNKHWTKLDASEIPENYQRVENGCYF